MKKPVFRRGPTQTFAATEDCYRLKISDLVCKGIVLYCTPDKAIFCWCQKFLSDPVVHLLCYTLVIIDVM